MAEINEVIVGLLHAGQTIELRASGVSMLPLLWPRMCLRTEPCAEFKRGDIVVYIDNVGKLVAHRIVQVGADGIVLRGDSCLATDPIVAPCQIAGVVTHMRIAKLTLSIVGFWGKLYCRMLLLASPLSHNVNHIFAIFVAKAITLRGKMKR